MLFPLIISLSLILIAYLLGSTPTGYLAGRYFQGIDIREYGSKSIGATNVLRTVGKTAAAIVLVVDLLKGAAAVALVKIVFALPAIPLPENWQPWLVLATGLMAILGHSKSIFLNFTGGKSVATSLGILLVMNPVVAISTVGVFSLVLAVSRIVSLSSISGAIAVNIFMILLNQPLAYEVFAAIAAIYVIWRHQKNIQRLLAGTEPKIGQKLASDNAAE